MDKTVRYTSDLININPAEREIIIAWGNFCIEDNEEERALLKRFTDWKENDSTT